MNMQIRSFRQDPWGFPAKLPETHRRTKVFRMTRPLRRCASLFALLVGGGLVLPALLPRGGHAQGAGLPQQAKAILGKHCAACHNPADPFDKGFDVARRDTVVTLKKAVIPGAPEKSELLLRIRNGSMPPGGTKLSAAEQKTLQDWIAAGAADWDAPAGGAPSKPRAPIAERDLLNAIVRDLEGADELDRKFLRYFSLANLHNNPDIPAERLALFRSALSKLVNHLSWEREIQPPKTVGASGTVLRLDLRHYQWTAETWNKALELYPYGYVARGLEGQVRQIHALSGTDLPYLRVDWFIANASLPPLYHDFLQLPTHVRDLERKLGVNAAQNVMQFRAVRGGRQQSGVSRNNRVVERHASLFGAYYKSYDFAGNRNEQNIFLNPIHFQEDGGEFIFHLPNGLQGYLIAKADGARLDEAPTNIVFDSGNKLDPVVRNGLSCIGCHVKGVNRFTDQIRPALELFVRRRAGFDVDEALRLYPPQADLDRLFRQDEELFVAALKKTGANVPESRLQEPVFLLALDYFGQQQTNSVPVSQAAAEVYLSTAEFQRRVDRSTELERLGFNSLLGPAGAIKRDTWEAAFAVLVEEVGVGRGVRPQSHARVEHRVGGNHDRRIAVSVGALAAPTAAQGEALRRALIGWLQRSSDVRVVETGGDYQLGGTLRPVAGATRVEIGDPRKGVQVSATGRADDLDGLAEQTATQIHLRIAGTGLPVAARPAGGGPPPAGVAADVAGLLAGAAQGDGPVTLRLTLDRGPGATYRAGEVVDILFSVDRDCHLVLYNTDSTGKTIILFPHDPNNPTNRVRGGAVQSFKAQVDPNGNFGVESVVAVASLEPIRNLPGLREFQANPSARSLKPLDLAPREVAADLRRAAQPGGLSSVSVRFFSTR